MTHCRIWVTLFKMLFCVHQCSRLQFLSKLATFVLVFLEFAVLHFFLQLPMRAGSVTRCRIPPIQLPLLVTVGHEANFKHL